MPDACRPTRTHDLPEAATTNRIARQLADGLPEAFAADIWPCLAAAFAGRPVLLAEVTRLQAELADIRLDRANLAAAALATIGAHHDGEPDPLFYLRDELAAQGHHIRMRR